MGEPKIVRRIVMQKIINNQAFQASKDFDEQTNEHAESWIREHEALGYRVVADRSAPAGKNP